MRQLFSYSFLVPPTIFIVIGAIGALIGLTGRRAGSLVALTSLVLLYLFATPAVSALLLGRLADLVPPPAADVKPEAIVVLGADEQYGAGSSSDITGPLTEQRVAAAARLYHRLHLPVAVTGGPIAGHEAPVAELMRDELERDFSVPVRWVEARSQSTFQNAAFTAELLRRDGIHTVIVVTQPWHLPRALWSFERVGMRALPFEHQELGQHVELGSFLPSAFAELRSFYGVHEAIGLLYYRLAY